MTLKLIAGPAAEPVSLAEAKLHLRVSHSAEDALISALISAAREEAEHLTNRALVTQTWEQVLDAFPLVELELGKTQVQSVQSITYIDEAGATQTLAPSAYVLDDVTAPGWVLPVLDTDWPTTQDTVNAVRVRFTTGYGAAGDVPAGIKAWILLRVGTLYRFREEFQAGTVAELPGGFVDRLLDPYRVYA